MESHDESLPELVEDGLDLDPHVQFRRWYQDALEKGISQPEAMTLATATPEGRPSARIVLMKHHDERGFVFYTNYQSRKSRELEANPRAALIFHWEPLKRQVRIEGRVERVSPEESDRYFASRPRPNQLSALVSNQSQPARRADLDRRFEQARIDHEGRAIVRPPHWGGYRVVAESIEFWQHRVARLNDRVAYLRSADGTWKMLRLAP
jgi:pyridoxamine 5'-phosphate oxidase